MSRALQGTPFAKMLEGMTFSEESRRAVVEVYGEIVERVRRDLTRNNRHAGVPPPSEAAITAAADVQATGVPKFKVAIDNEQWGYRLTTMYALVELTAQQSATNTLLGELVREIKALNEHLVGIPESEPQARSIDTQEFDRLP